MYSKFRAPSTILRLVDLGVETFLITATVEAIVDVGAIPIIVNIDDTLNMDPSEFEKAITPRTKAVIPVDMLGVATEVDQIKTIVCSSGGLLAPVVGSGIDRRLVFGNGVAFDDSFIYFI